MRFETADDYGERHFRERRRTDLAGRTIVITGASDGIGKVAARRIVEMGAHVVIVGRDRTKTESVVSDLQRTDSCGAASSEIADLSQQRAVHDLSARLLARLPRIDALVNNAGAIFAERKLTPEGLERTFALNHLAYFTLKLLLLPRLAATGTAGRPARIINVASRAHHDANLDFDDLQSERSFRAWRTYNNTKLENILFTRALARRLEPSRVVTHSLHPGLVASQFAVSDNGLWGRFMRMALNVRSITPERGADTIIHLVSSADAAEKTDLYWDRCAVTNPSASAQNDADGERLWRASARLTGLDADQIADGVRHTHSNASNERMPNTWPPR